MADSFLDSLSTGVIFTNCSGILTFMNRKAETLLNVFKETVIGKRIDMLPLRTPLYKVLSEDCRDYPLEMNICGRVLQVRSSEVLSSAKVLLGSIYELSDVTAERDEKRSREEFVAKMTHDLKSPLMVLQGYVQAIKLGMWGDIHPKLQKTLEDMERSGKSLYSMIEDLLDVYRLEMGLVQIKRLPCDLAALLESCCHDRQLEADEQGVSLVVKLPRKFQQVELDTKQFSRVFANIVGNAVKFTPRGGKVTVSAQVRQGNFRVSVKDSGIGIAESDTSSIFKKYFRTEQAAGFKGSGLGLALSKEIVEAHGGTIEVTSVVGKGSTFTVIAPIKE
ncbi:MAG: PAS domain-containing sensor histidine kinase [Deltaproteobacteria bacterium]|nr:PAS domain-containing sensor histidine kinase [Deltaproteobacteria bacterium]TLN04855.1 MAG: PAS domain-containing sensor histidine kinase [bacterium]